MKLAGELLARGVNLEVGGNNIQDKKNVANNGVKNGEGGNDVKDHNGEDND